MKKKELVYMEALYRVIEKKEAKLTQFSLALVVGVSLSTVNNALKPLASMGAVELTRNGLKVRDLEKFLAYWACLRSLEKDVAYKTRVEKPVTEIEKSMPAKAVYTAYSAFKFLFNDVPADYSEVYVYAGEKTLEEIKRRFPERKGPANLFVLKADALLEKVSPEKIVPLAVLYVDLWNLKEWYAKYFLKAIEGRLW